MYSIMLFELTLPVDKDTFDKLLDRAIKTTKKKDYQIYSTDFGYVDESLLSKGIGIAYHDDKQKKKIKLVVYPAVVIHNDSSDLWKPSLDNISKLLDKLGQRIDSYFQPEYGLDEFKLSHVNFVTDIAVGSRERVRDYIKVLQNINKVKRFSPMKYDKNGEIIDKERCFALRGNTIGVEFWAYGPKHEKEILRVEVRLIKNEVIRAYSGDVSISEQLQILANNGKHIFMDTFKYIIPHGDYHKKGEAERLVVERVSNGKIRRAMLRLVELIPVKKSLYLAQKALNVRDMKEVMAEFAEIDVSPVTISKRHDVKKLESLYSYLGKSNN